MLPHDATVANGLFFKIDDTWVMIHQVHEQTR